MAEISRVKPGGVFGVIVVPYGMWLPCIGAFGVFPSQKAPVKSACDVSAQKSGMG
jgi:hypothetical protein